MQFPNRKLLKNNNSQFDKVKATVFIVRDVDKSWPVFDFGVFNEPRAVAVYPIVFWSYRRLIFSSQLSR